MKTLDDACEVMHDAYEKAALGAGWETHPASRKPWADVPEANKATMRAAVAALIEALKSHMIPEGAYNDHNRAEAQGDRIALAYHEGMFDSWSALNSLVMREPSDAGSDRG